jgi:hypothetical protein
VLAACTSQGFTIARVETHQLAPIGDAPAVAVVLEVQGQPRPETLATSLSDLPGVHEVSATDFAQTPD